MAKLISTHVTLPSLGTVHVAGSRLQTLRLFDVAQSHGDIGVDLPVYVQSTPADDFQKSTIWVGISHIRRAFVSNEHEVEVSDVPFSPQQEDHTPTQTPTVSDDLTVTLQ